MRFLRASVRDGGQAARSNAGRLGRQFTLGVFASTLLLVGLTGAPAPAAPGDPCAAPVESPVACENTKPGNPTSDWQIHNAGSSDIVGFATDISVNKGETVRFKVKTTASAYTIQIFRLGYYQGLGARKIADVGPSASLPQTQPACLTVSATGLIDCGNWAQSASWAVPSTAVSGVYVAKLRRPDTGGDSHIYFVVRDDTGVSDVLFQTSDTTWQAYNSYGGNSLYAGSPAGRAYKVSYNRPFVTRDGSAHSFLFSAEYPMIRWLEANGYDVSYTTGVDTARRGAELLEHGVFLSVGHDEYWSAGQRSNVEAARDAGVHLGFFSGNEVFWKTRWEPSVDPTSTPFRTLVSYKETHANAKIDPDPAWTGTWRDPRFSPPSDGGRPENALTGTLFTVNGYREDSITVPAAYKDLRLWRNTSITSLSSGQAATFPAGTLGYEWDEVVDNGFRPPGLFQLSSTTVSVPARLQDHGSNYSAGQATHGLTMYRAPSGALVFGSGTLQWAWGLDDTHDVVSGNPPRPPDVRMRQATVNLLADMGTQPHTLQPGLALASASSDATAPNTTITAPANGAAVSSGTAIPVTGTVVESGGGVISAVEVSTDGGVTWHPANGRASWTYTWTVSGFGNVTLLARGVDDSGNVDPTPANVTVNISCPCSIWNDSAVPETTSSGDNRAVELGVRFRADVTGYVTGVRFYKGAQNLGTHYGSLWTNSGTLLARAAFTGETATGWQQVLFDEPVQVTAGTNYVASYHAPVGRYAVTPSYFTTAFVNVPLRAVRDGDGGANGLFRYNNTPAFPDGSSLSRNYWVDVVFATTIAPDTTPPTVTGTAPGAGSTSADTRAAVTATFNEGLDPATVTEGTFELRDSANALVPASVGYATALRKATLTPLAPLAHSSTYTARLRGGPSGVKDKSGNALAADYTWQFTTAAPRACPCSIWPSSARPEVESNGDTRSIELGVRFRADSDGFITGIRFYKSSANTGTHVGSLWSRTGALLARATFTGESGSGWQQVLFDGPIAVKADTTYLASYFAPNGGYSYTRDYFVTTFDSPPLRGLRDGMDGVNGLYRYAGTPAFPDGGFLSTNYWVDVVYERGAPSDTTAPRVTAVSPSAGTSDASVSTTVEAIFSETMNLATINGNTVQLRNASGTVVPATITYDGDLNKAVLRPTAPLSYSATYTATVRGGAAGVKDLAGNSLASDHTWSFATKTCPCSIWPNSALPALQSNGDTNSVELGVKFRATTNGSVVGIRFYKSAVNTGTHVGSLWTPSGTLLGRATFTGETASGWQNVFFAAPVPITSGVTYVASYHAPNGGYSVSTDYFTAAVDNPPLRALRDGEDGANGLFVYSATPAFPERGASLSRNYWVDVLFSAGG